MMKILQITCLFLLSVLIPRCTFINTDITINVDAKIMVYQDIALELLNSVDSINIGPIPIILGQTSNPNHLAETAIVGGIQAIILDVDIDWENNPALAEIAILHEHGHIQGVPHMTGIMSSTYNKGFVETYKKDKMFWINLLAQAILEQKAKNQHNQGSVGAK